MAAEMRVMKTTHAASLHAASQASSLGRCVRCCSARQTACRASATTLRLNDSRGREKEGSFYGKVQNAKKSFVSSVERGGLGTFVRSVRCESSSETSSSSTTDNTTLLDVKELYASVVSDEEETQKRILNGVSLTIRKGEVHAIMGKNGSGKSTLSKILVGHHDYKVDSGSAIFKGDKNLFNLEPEERAREGLFLSFQSPIEIPGVSNIDFLRLAVNSKRKSKNLPEMDPLEFYGFVTPKLEKLNMDVSFLNRNVNEGFSGGERKRNEVLQLACLEADVAILDEIDSGLDVDALRDVATAVNGLRTGENAVLLITHYNRLLELVKPDFVHVMSNGKIVESGDASLAVSLEQKGFTSRI